jgi:hypothetical protein
MDRLYCQHWIEWTRGRIIIRESGNIGPSKNLNLYSWREIKKDVKKKVLRL